MKNYRPQNLSASSLAFALHAASACVAEVLSGRSLTDVLDAFWRRESLPREVRGAIQDLSYSALRHYGWGDFVLNRLMAKPLSALPVRALLLVVLSRLDARSDEAHTIVNQAVEAAAVVNGGRWKALVNGVLRNYLRQKALLEIARNEDEEARWRYPSWWLRRLQCRYPEQWPSVMEAGNGRPPMGIRVNRRRLTVGEYLRMLKSVDIAAEEDVEESESGLRLLRPVPIEKLPGFDEGLVSVQDLGAQRAATILAASEGHRVLDACAAPGGKTTHLLECADIDLLALDADTSRLSRVESNLARLDLHADLKCADCRRLDDWWDGKFFDRILADVPCSASGVVRRHPDIKWLRRETDIAGFTVVQAEILDVLWRTLAPGGKLLYATCSLFEEENTEVVTAFAARTHDCYRVPIKGLPEIQLLPNDRHDGFYYALLEKR